MATKIAPQLEIFSDSTITNGGTATLTITLPVGASYKVRSATFTGTNVNTAVTMTSGASTFLTTQTVGNATLTFDMNTDLTATGTLVIVVSGGGTITKHSITLVSASGYTLAATVT